MLHRGIFVGTLVLSKSARINPSCARPLALHTPSRGEPLLSEGFLFQLAPYRGLSGSRFNVPPSAEFVARPSGIASMFKLPIQDSPVGLDAAFVGVPIDTGTSNRPGASNHLTYLLFFFLPLRFCHLYLYWITGKLCEVICELIAQGFRVVEAGECWWKSLTPLMAETVGDGPVYLSFDIDALDPSYAPGTGTPEIAGLTPIQALEIIRGCRGMNIVGCNLVEVSPPYDTTGRAEQRDKSKAAAFLCAGVMVSASLL
ncbi:SPEB protein, partial [Polyodon spathula]|nr:SPEB protein [Polyodon spathula]